MNHQKQCLALSIPAQGQAAHPGNVRRPRLDPPRKLLLAAVGVLVAGDQVPALDGHRLPVVDEILNTIGAAATHLNLFNKSIVFLKVRHVQK